MKGQVRPAGSIAPLGAIVFFALAGGILGMIDKHLVEAFAHGIETTMKAVPEAFFALAGTTFLGYAASRSYDKKGERELEARRHEAEAITEFSRAGPGADPMDGA